MNVYVYLFYYPGSVKLADIRCGDAEKPHWFLIAPGGLPLSAHPSANQSSFRNP
jgi:hypothetical protein